jgi:hypothetical protein
MRIRILGVAKLLLICALLAGCGGVHSDLVYRPLAPVLPDKQAPLGRERGAGWELDLSDAELHIWPVTLSSKLICVVGPACVIPTFWEKEVPEEGPLKIGVFVKSKHEASVAFDPREFTVVLEDGRSLPPNAARRHSSNEAEPIGPVMLSGGQVWRGYLQYDISLMDLTPFTLRLGTLYVNGEAVQFPPISFVRGKSGHSS